MINNKLVISILLGMVVMAGCEEALEKPLTDKKPVLLAPSNNLSTTDREHTFYWEEMEGAFKYQLQVVSPGFNLITRLVEDTSISGARFTLTLPPGTYQWRVRAKNESTVSQVSDVWTLTVQ